MKLAIIVAQSNNRVIGKDNDLPWRLPKDLQYFKKVQFCKFALGWVLGTCVAGPHRLFFF